MTSQAGLKSQGVPETFPGHKASLSMHYNATHLTPHAQNSI